MNKGSAKPNSHQSSGNFVVETNQGLNLKLARMQEWDREFERQAKRLRYVSRRLRRKLTGVM